MMQAAAVISYSSYHNPFIARCIDEAKKVAAEVIVVSYDHFFDGQVDTELLKLEGVNHIKLKYSPGHSSRHYHNEGRKAGFDAIQNKDIDGVFFIDSDEILEGQKVASWMLEIAEPTEDYKLAHFWYYRDTCYRAKQVEEGAVFLSMQTATSPLINWYSEREREGFSNRWNYMEGYKGRPLGHHYSWAGTKDMLLRKVNSWGHNADNFNWIGMVENEFSHDFDFKCPFRPQYQFIQVEPYVKFAFNE